jgi:hypothetical protein
LYHFGEVELRLRQRLLAWLGDPAVSVHDPETAARLRSGLGADTEASLLVSVGRHGTVTCSAPSGGDAPPRPLIEFDRLGTLLALARWDEAGRLAWAKLRLPDGRWIGIEPRAPDSPLWGESDRLWLLADGAPFTPAEALSHFQATDYGTVSAIPALAEPERLPPGAGTTVLNFLASLLVRQGTARVLYRGPYPTEQLFTALLESFRYEASAADPLERFQRGDLAWIPAPHERRFLPDGICLHLRDGVEKVVFGGRSYYRRQWQSVIRAEPRVIREEGKRTLCSLWALGRPIEDHLVLSPDGEVIDIPEIRAESGPVESLSQPWLAALDALLAHQSAPALGPWLTAAREATRIEWGPVAGDILSASDEGIRVSLKLPRSFRERLAGCRTEAERLQLALGFVSDVARLVGPTLRLRAQRLLVALSEAVQREALENPPEPPALASVEQLAKSLSAGAGCPSV